VANIMANVQIALSKTLAFEGGYSNNPNDNGGETYKGISRVNFPKWLGWYIIDNYKKTQHNTNTTNITLKDNKDINNLVQSFYKANFWDRIMGDNIIDQDKANNIFDFSVNSGISRAIKYAQMVVGVTQDGVMGQHTLDAINADSNFVSKYKELRLSFLNKIVSNNPSQQVFLNGWTTRVENA
jgi:lysozyme family protein